MDKKSENTQFQNATASTLKAISGDLDSEREIKFSGSSSYLSSKEIRLPQILKELDNNQLSTFSKLGLENANSWKQFGLGRRPGSVDIAA